VDTALKPWHKKDDWLGPSEHRGGHRGLKLTAMDAVTDCCEKIHTEVFRTKCVENVRQKCDKFFELMPRLTSPTEVGDASSKGADAPQR
jgi:hypothetical protein